MIQFALIHVEAKYLAIYTCSLCGAQAAGETERVEFRVGSSQAVADAFQAQRLSSRGMPVGWGSYYPDVFKCPTCV